MGQNPRYLAGLILLPKICSRKIVVLTVIEKKLTIKSKYRYYISREGYSMLNNSNRHIADYTIRDILCTETLLARS